MFKKLLLVAVIATAITGCSSKKAAFNYSQDIVSKERSLTPEIESTETKIASYITAGEFDSVVVAAGHMESQVQKKIDEIQAMKTPSAKKVNEFKAATIKYFGYIKSIYTTYKEYGGAATDEARQQALEKLQKQVEDKTTVINEMQTAQREYASANGFKVES